jgi:hypothetical protein
MLAVAMTSLMAGTANASEADCAGGANGFVDIPDNLNSDFAPRWMYVGAEILYLYIGNVDGAQRGWALLGSNGASLQSTDQVWMDWTQDNGRTWLQCGPFGPTGYEWSITSAAKATSPTPGYRFRAGANIDGIAHVTDWY